MVEIVPIIILAVVVIVIIALAASLLSHKAKPISSTTANVVSLSTNNGITNANAQVNTSARVDFYDVNVQYVYSGPSTNGSISCAYSSYSYIDSQSLTINGSKLFALRFQPTTTNCPLEITGVNVDTPGFSLIATDPSMPIFIPPRSQIQMQFNIETPETSYYGPLTITIYDQ